LETITITLNGREVSGYPGTTVLELARESGVDIPTLCYDPRLAPYGACRVCIVEDERSGTLMAACVTPIAPGMVINTASQRVLERRKIIVELMLASHPDSCLVCDKGNRCELRQIASDLGVGLVGFQRLHQPATIQDVNPFIERDLSKCILCAKCIRVDHELVVEGVIDYLDRGFKSKPATLGDLPLEQSECTFCGTCVAVCPTGALMEKNRAYSGSTTSSVSTVCPLCGCGCSILLETKADRIVRAVPDKNGGVSRGALCVRGSYGLDFVHSPDRLSKPLVKRNGTLEEASWEEVLEVVSAGLAKVVEENGPDSMAVLGSSKCTNEENYLLQRFARGVLGTNNVDNGSRLYSAGSRVGIGWTLGVPGSTGSLEDLEQSEVILVIGADPANSAPAVSYAIKRAVKYGSTRLLLVDPRKTKLAAMAHLWLKPRVGSDVALINGMSRIIVDEGLLDEEYVTRRTDNYDAFKESLKPFLPEYVEQTTGVLAEEMVEAARIFAGAGQASIVCGNGIVQHISGSEASMAVANLAMLTGNVGRNGGGVYALQRDNNAQGAADMGTLPGFLPGYQSVKDADVRQSFEVQWGSTLPAEIGLTALEMIQQARERRIRGMYVVGENPVMSFPNAALVREALSSLDFLVVQDLFLTETARLATVVLPAASFAEKDGTFTNFEGRVQRVRRAIRPYGESLPDWEILLHVAQKMGKPMPYASVEDIMDEIETLVPLYHAMGYPDLSSRTPHRREAANGRLWSRRLYKGQFPRAFDRFHPVEWTPDGHKSQDAYPMTLVTGSTLYQAGTGSSSSRSRRLGAFQQKAVADIHRDDASALGISDGDTVRLISPNGEVVATAGVGNSVARGMVFVPISFPGTPVNALFDVSLDARSKSPELKACSIRLERMASDGTD